MVEDPLLVGLPIGLQKNMGIFVRSNPSRIRNQRPRVIFVSRVQHQLHAIQLEQCPIEPFFVRLRGGDNLEPQHIPVKYNGRRHIEHLEQRGHPSNFNAHATSC